MTDIFEVIGPLFRKLTETCIAHQIAEIRFGNLAGGKR